MLVAVRAVGLDEPARTVVTIPLADPEGCDALREEADDVVCVRTPQPLRWVGAW
jgi:putative phosphoribosyl transferase